MSTEPLLTPNANPSHRASSWSWAHWEGPIATMQLDNFTKFIGHMGGIKVIKQGDEHSHHQSALIVWSQIRPVARLEQEMKRLEITAVGIPHLLKILSCSSKARYNWPRHSTCHVITQRNSEGLGSVKSDEFVVFDDPLNGAPMEFNLLPVGSLYMWNAEGSEPRTKSSLYCFDISLAVELAEGYEDSQEESANQSCVQRGRGDSALLPDRYRRLGLAVKLCWVVPEDSGWEAIKAGFKVSFASFSPVVDFFMAWFPFGLFRRFHSYKPICLI
ncbi:hypothetical protein MCOR25_010247 [Pyricularia grisea]|nr:hypothetical protein MCOR25_010247 [Pyricularia grisea]